MPGASPAGDLREQLLEIAALGAQRKPGPDRRWTSGLAAEQELLASAEALCVADSGSALADRLDAAAPLEGLTAGGAFARALALGTASGEAAAEAAARTLLGVRPEARAACVDALSLAPSPTVAPAVQRLLDDAPSVVAAAALEVLRFRRQCAYGPVVIFLAHPVPAVAATAARCLGTVAERRAAASVLRHLLSRGPASTIDAVALAAAEALLTLGDPAGLAFVRAKLEAESVAPALPDESRVAYLRLLALGGDAGDRELFFRSVEPGPPDATAVGWFGHPDLVDWLLGSLEAANEARRAKGPASAPTPFEAAAARALHRILGSPHGPDAPPRANETLVTESGPWRGCWARLRAKGPLRQKLRFGQPYTPDATVDELEAETLFGSARADAALELSIVSKGAAVLETHDWVARQRAVLASARATLGREAYPAGAFPGARLAER
jgi:hypothetical protein